MEIIVNGKGRVKYFPDQVVLSFTFSTLKPSYDEAIDCGTKAVKNYFETLSKAGFDTKQVKTTEFKVTEEKQYIRETGQSKLIGYRYNQTSSLTFDYDMKKLSTLIEETSKDENFPKYRINFNIKDTKKAQEEVLKEAYINAKVQAEAIAKASGKTLRECVKTSFKPFDSAQDFYSTSSFGNVRMAKNMSMDESFSIKDRIEETFTPEDVEISKDLYCAWIAE